MKASATRSATVTTSTIGRSDLTSFFPNRRLEAMRRRWRMRERKKKEASLSGDSV
jgi:hypothetical protein